MNSNTKSSELLKREVFTQLDKIDTDLDVMTDRMSPGQLIDDVIYYPRGGNPAATFDLLKSNPVGATFLTLGTMLLMEDESHVTYEQRGRAQMGDFVDRTRTSARGAIRAGQESIDTLREGVNQVKGKILSSKQEASSYVQNLKSTVKQKVSGEMNADAIIAKDGASADFDSLSEGDRAAAINDAKAAFGDGERGSALKAKISEKISDIKDQLGERVSDVTDTLNSQAESLSDNIGQRVSSGVSAAKGVDPLTYVAIGAGLGTLTGIGLPVPESERAAVDKVDEKISAFTQDLQSALNESADILKDLVLSDFKNLSIGAFKR